jgi:hypothetical protein
MQNERDSIALPIPMPKMEKRKIGYKVSIRQ